MFEVTATKPHVPDNCDNTDPVLQGALLYLTPDLSQPVFLKRKPSTGGKNAEKTPAAPIRNTSASSALPPCSLRHQCSI